MLETRSGRWSCGALKQQLSGFLCREISAKYANSILAGDNHAAEKFFKGEYLANLAIADFGKPIIVVCDGLVMRRWRWPCATF